MNKTNEREQQRTADLRAAIERAIDALDAGKPHDARDELVSALIEGAFHD